MHWLVAWAWLFASSGTVMHDIDRDGVRRIVQSHRPELVRCYESGLARNPDLHGRLVVHFTVRRAGDVGTVHVAESQLNDPGVEECISRTIALWKFPPLPDDVQAMTLSYPFLLRRARANPQATR